MTKTEGDPSVGEEPTMLTACFRAAMALAEFEVLGNQLPALCDLPADDCFGEGQ
jgi:hypothetical protein